MTVYPRTHPRGKTTPEEGPSARFSTDGDLYVGLDLELAESPMVGLVRLALTDSLPDDAFDWHPGGDVAWIRWDHARAVERRARRMWPDIQVTSEANPDYRGPAVGR